MWCETAMRTVRPPWSRYSWYEATHTVSIRRTPSSRAMIAAGTSPPRVTHTIACQLPCPDSRQASARASRWNWSHETGNAFSGRGSTTAIGISMRIAPSALSGPQFRGK